MIYSFLFLSLEINGGLKAVYNFKKNTVDYKNSNKIQRAIMVK